MSGLTPTASPNEDLIEANQNHRLFSSARSFLPILLFLVSLFILYRLLSELDFSDLSEALVTTSWIKLSMSALLCLLNYIVLGFYDLLACRSLGKTIPVRKIFEVSLTSYSVSQTIGLPFLTGGAVRYRLYRPWNFSTADVLKISIFATTFFWLGLLFLASLMALVAPHLFSENYFVGRSVIQIIGACICFSCLLLVFSSGPTLFGITISQHLPSVRYRAFGLLISCIDWLLASLTLFVLFPAKFQHHFLISMAAYLQAQVLGIASNVPGGLGVFEASFLYFLGKVHPTPSMVSALLVYRGIYYLLPFFCGFLALNFFEIKNFLSTRTKTPVFVGGAFKAVSSFVPLLLSSAVFISGLILLLSGSSPTAHNRAWWISEVVPLFFVEGSHFLNSIIGTLLLILALSIRKRLKRAWTVTVVMLGVGIVISIVKGLDYEEALYLASVAFVLLRFRQEFTRTGNFVTRLTAREISLIVLAIGAALWLGFFSYRNIKYTNTLWWEFAASSDAPRFLRAVVTSCVVILALYLTRFLRSPRFQGNLPSESDIQELLPIIKSQDQTEAFLALTADKFVMWGKDRRSFVMFGIQGRSWVSLGDPVAASYDERAALLWQFRELCDEHNALCVFYEVGVKNLPLYLDAGLDLFKLGEHATVDLKTFSLEGSSGKSFRHSVKRLERESYHFSVVAREDFQSIKQDVRSVSDAWLGTKATREKGFSLGFFDDKYLSFFDCAVVRKDQKIVAFANVLATSSKEELSVDLMRFLPGINGIMDYLFIKLMLWGKENEYQTFNLGMAPLSGLTNARLSRFWTRAGSYLFRHGEHFYNFKGLREYKEKFNPSWEPRYLASPGGIHLPVVLANVGSLVSGGLKGLVAK